MFLVVVVRWYIDSYDYVYIYLFICKFENQSIFFNFIRLKERFFSEIYLIFE